MRGIQKIKEVDLTGILPAELDALEAEELAIYINSYKLLQKPIHVYQVIRRFLQSEKLSVEEIALCLNMPKSVVQKIQIERATLAA